MKFGKISEPGAVHYELPELSPSSLERLAGFEHKKKKEVFIGCPVWSDKSYVGNLYPEKTKAADFLYYYSRQFNSIELNSTHYNIPKLETVHKWREAAADGFLFCPKFPQSISHRKDFYERHELIDRFITNIYEFDQKLGMSFIQFPPYAGPSYLEGIYRFLSFLPEDFKIAIELRHPDWFIEGNQNQLQEYFSMLENFNACPIITDVSGRRDVLHQAIVSDTVFIRFNGNDLHPTDYYRMDLWADTLIDWMKKGINRVYFFVHEPEKHLCAAIASYLIERLNRYEACAIKAPVLYNNQKDLFADL